MKVSVQTKINLALKHMVDKCYNQQPEHLEVLGKHSFWKDEDCKKPDKPKHPEKNHQSNKMSFNFKELILPKNKSQVVRA